jgi:hypothetical protein
MDGCFCIDGNLGGSWDDKQVLSVTLFTSVIRFTSTTLGLGMCLRAHVSSVGVNGVYAYVPIIPRAPCAAQENSKSGSP